MTGMAVSWIPLAARVELMRPASLVDNYCNEVWSRLLTMLVTCRRPLDGFSILFVCGVGAFIRCN